MPTKRTKRRLALERWQAEREELSRAWAACPNVTHYAGIDYRGFGPRVNQRGEFHYGVISINALGDYAWESFEADYGEPTCGVCGSTAVEIDNAEVPDLDEEPEGWDDDGRDYACLTCQRSFDSDDAFGDEPLGHYLDNGEYKAWVDSHYDVMITQSPYFTYAQYCSPCAPGAGHLENPTPLGIKTYCFGHDWFNDDKAPYPVFSCKTNKLIKK